MKKSIRLLLFILNLSLFSTYSQFNKSTLPELQLGLSINAYYAQCNFANALNCDERGWTSPSGFVPKRTGLFDANGYPKWLPDTTANYPNGTPLLMFPGQNASTGRNGLYRGLFCVTWEGDGDITLDGTFQGSSPTANYSSGRMVNGKRYYLNGVSSQPDGVRCLIRDINPLNPPHNIRMWMPDPADPFNKSLEPAAGQPEPIFHPSLLDKLSTPSVGVIRSMDWTITNSNPVIYWKERRKPSFTSQASANFTPRVVPGGAVVTWSDGTTFPAPTSGNAGVSYEYVIELSNKLNKDMWINIPHAATNGFVDSLAMLVNGLDPDKTGCTGLNSNLRVFIEYSNEIWTPCSNTVRGGFFTQGCYAEDQKTAYNASHGTNLTREQWIARRFCEVWSIFKNRMNDPNRLVNVLATWTIAKTYTQAMCAEASTYGLTLSPSVKPDVLACTNYFGNNIEQYIFSNSPWLSGTATSGSLDSLFKEWKYRILGEEAASNGKDYQGGGGGFGVDMINISKQYHLPLVAYEGGMSLSSSYSASIYVPTRAIVSSSTPGAWSPFYLGREGCDSVYNYNYGWSKATRYTGRDRFASYITAVQRDQRYGEMYYLNNLLAKAKGMYTPSQFGLTGQAGGVFGQWGIFENLDQVNSTAPKYNGMIKFYNEFKDLREIDDSIGTRPFLNGNAELPSATAGVSYNYDIVCTGGDRAIRFDNYGDLPQGISLITGSNKVTVAGTPTITGTYRFGVRAIDDDNDFSLRIFTIRVLPTPNYKAFAYDDFGQKSGIKLDSLNTGTGWNDMWRNPSHYWIIPNRVPADTVNTIQAVTPFTHAILKTSGTAYAKLGGGYVNRKFDLTQCPSLVASNAPTFVGQTGTSLWSSFLMRNKDLSTQTTTTDQPIFSYTNLGGSAGINAKNFVLNLSLTNKSTLALAIKDTSTMNATLKYRTIATNKVFTNGAMDLIVMAVDFQQPYDRVRLYINPTNLGTTEPATPDLTVNLTKTDADMLFSHCVIDGTANSNKIWMDDVRFGETYAAVTPQKTADTQAPTIPTGLTFAKATNDTLNLIWTPSTDNVGVVSYKVYLNSQLYVTVAQPSLMLINPTVNQTMNFKVLAVDYSGNESALSSEVSITLSDTKAPTAPTGLNATDKWTNRFTLNWTASTDNVGVTSYQVYKDGVLVGTTTGTSYQLSGLIASTSYSMTVKAFDVVGNNVTSATLDVFTLDPDIEAPTAPSALNASNIDYTSFTLKWTASTDNVAVSKYYIYLNNTLKDSTISTSISVQNLISGVSYAVKVRAKDTSGNQSPDATLNGVQTLSDTTAPTAPSGLTYSSITTTSFSLTWNASTDNVGVSSYDVYKNGVLYVNTTSTSLSLTGLTSGVTYTMTIKAKDAAGNASTGSIVSVQTIPPVTNKNTYNPVADTDTNHDVAAGTNTSIYTGGGLCQIFMKFDLSSFNATVFTAKLRLYHAYAKTPYTLSGYAASNTTWTEGGTKPTMGSFVNSASLSGAVGYDSLDISSFVQNQMNNGKIVSLVISNNLGVDMSYYSRESATFKPELVITSAPAVVDQIPPTAPTALNATLVHGNDFTLNWTASTDNVGVTSYDVYKNGVFYGSSSTTSMLIGSLTSSTIYSMTVYAKDVAGNISAVSSSLSITTLDNSPPTTPTTLITSDKTATGFTLSWTASSDNVGVTSYDVFKDGTLYGNTTSTSISISGLSSGLIYTMTIKAKDAAGNVSTTSSALPVQTIDVISPSAPTSLQSSSVSLTSFTLSWTASTDNVGVIGYDVYKDGLLYGSTTTATTLNITGLTAGSTYTMNVVAKDATGNTSQSSDFNQSALIATVSTTTLNPTADTNSSGDVAAGTNTTLNCTKSVPIYIKFDLTSYSGVLSSGKLRIYEATSRSGGYTMIVSTTSTDSWVEGGTKPAVGTTISTTTESGTVGYIEIDLTSYVITKLTSNKIVSIALTTNVSPSITFNSRQNVANLPELVLVATPSDTQAPSSPTSLANSNLSATSFTLSWSASTDNVGVVGYDVYKNGVLCGSTTSTSLNITGLTSGVTYIMTVKAKDGIGYTSASSTSLSVTTIDNIVPVAPEGLISSNITTSSFTLNWNASTDNVGVIGYDVYKNGVLYGFTTQTTMVINGLTSGVGFSMTVVAKDATGNASDTSVPLMVYTNITTEISENTNHTFNIFPNPISTRLHISCDSQSGNLKIQIKDIYGRIVYYQNRSEIFDNQIEISLSGLLDGIYLLAIETCNSTFNAKFIKKQ